ncbi:MAG TPA: GIY-YIG nuclease family protein, partial [Parafilimonas sp.]|nr:GIY-YIG nuclease family protein [Parafilimonas sp.]
MQYGGTVYILTNVRHEVLYMGVTSDLFARIPEHIMKVFKIHLPQNIIATSLFTMKHSAE